MSFSHTLTPLQRKVANGIVTSICRGSYGPALDTLNSSSGTLPPGQEQSLRQLLKRLQGMRKMDTLIACEALIDELQLPELDASVITSMDTYIPSTVLAQIYEQMLTSSFGEFYKQLEHMQWVEHTIIRHTLILYEHCTKLKAAQRTLDRLQSMSGLKMELYILYALLLSIGVYLASFFF